MPTANNRFAISLLSRSNKAQSVAGEVMMDKATGQLLVKTLSGDIISYDSTARNRSHISDVTNMAMMNGIRNQIAQVDFENIELPGVLSENTNILLSQLLVKSGSPKRLLLSLDLDTIETATGAIGLEPTVFVDLRYTQGATVVNKSISAPLSQINSMAINSASFFPPATDLYLYNVYITSIYIRKNSGYTTQSLRHILHSVLLAVE